MTSSFKLACIIPPEPIHSNFFKIRTNNTTTQIVSFTAKTTEVSKHYFTSSVTFLVTPTTTLKLEEYRTKGLFYKQQTLLYMIINNIPMNYARLNCNNLNLNSLNWNYRGCWHQTSPQLKNSLCLGIVDVGNNYISFPHRLSLVRRFRACCNP